MESRFLTPVPPIGRICPEGSFGYPVGFGGEDFGTLMVRYNVPFDSMQVANPNMTASPLDPGQLVCIPQNGINPVCTNGYYTIPAGESLGSLPALLSGDIFSILRANPTLRPSEFTGGMTICRP